MAQHDYVLDNQTGAQFRADANSMFAAIVSKNSGATTPATTFAYQWWADTTSGILKIRNAANTAWVDFAVIDAANGGFLPLTGGTLTGAILAVSGALATPGIAFSGDANTGIHRPAADQISLVAGGAEMLRADFATYLKFLGTAAVLLPIGSTAQRPTGTNGLMRFNSDTGKYEGYAGGTWKDVGGGGGGAGFQWRAIAGNAPLIAEENGENVAMFEPLIAQEMFAHVKIPNGFSAGSPVSLYVSGYSPSSSGTIALKAQSTLVRKNTDALDSVVNQRSTTNAALTNTVANMLREFVLDITDASGQINGVTVSAGDIIKVRLYRDGSDTDTDTLRMIPNATDVKFS